MATKIRLQRHGRSKRPYYYVVVADSRARRDGKFIDRLGDYNPLTTPATINLDFDKAFDWIMKGAEPSDTCKKILSYKGVMYKKHLARGVRKGAMTPEEMEAKMSEWLSYKTDKIAARVEKLTKEKLDSKATKMAAETKKKEEYAIKLAEANTPPAELEAADTTTEEITDVVENIETAEVEVAAETPTEEVVEKVAETPADATEEAAAPTE